MVWKEYSYLLVAVEPLKRLFSLALSSTSNPTKAPCNCGALALDSNLKQFYLNFASDGFHILTNIDGLMGRYFNCVHPIHYWFLLYLPLLRGGGWSWGALGSWHRGSSHSVACVLTLVYLFIFLFIYNFYHHSQSHISHETQTFARQVENNVLKRSFGV